MVTTTMRKYRIVDLANGTYAVYVDGGIDSILIPYGVTTNTRGRAREVVDVLNAVEELVDKG